MTAAAGGVGTDDAAGCLNGLLARQQQTSETTILLQLTNATVAVEETTTYYVAVENVDGGVRVFDFSIAGEDASVASVTNVQLGSPFEQPIDVTVAENNASVGVVTARRRRRNWLRALARRLNLL